MQPYTFRQSDKKNNIYTHYLTIDQGSIVSYSDDSLIKHVARSLKCWTEWLGVGSEYITAWNRCAYSQSPLSYPCHSRLSLWARFPWHRHCVIQVWRHHGAHFAWVTLKIEPHTQNEDEIAHTHADLEITGQSLRVPCLLYTPLVLSAPMKTSESKSNTD